VAGARRGFAPTPVFGWFATIFPTSAKWFTLPFVAFVFFVVNGFLIPDL